MRREDQRFTLQTRRHFLRRLGAPAIGLALLGPRLALAATRGAAGPIVGFGPLEHVPAGDLDLPAGFTYRIISRVGERMDDGLSVPGRPDGMFAFAGGGARSVLLRNHELKPNSSATAFRLQPQPLSQEQLARIYDPSAGHGGVTTLVYDAASGRVERQFLSLAGTLHNCAGGATPWGSWISCEEISIRAGDFGATRDHGYNFEVPADAAGLVAAVPLVDMGRFNHEAVAVLDARGVTYQTEDQRDGLLYRFVPDRAGRLDAGGRLQALAVRDIPGVHTGNAGHGGRTITPGKRLPVDWIDLDEVRAPADDLRLRGRARGAAAFARGEGICVARGDSNERSQVWLMCTGGGPSGLGQLWCYRPSPHEGRPEERKAPGTLELFLEPDDATVLSHGDSVTMAPNGDLLICEDNRVLPRLLGVTPRGEVYVIAANPRRDSEFSGATFSPDGDTLFVNLQQRGVTLAISGPWHAPAQGQRAV